ncbi:MAG: tyrosine--tRNA ligase, partial [bacterium]
MDRLTRGAVEVINSEELRAKLALGRPLRIKVGVDPTSPDLHLGHTVVLTRLRAWQEAGHRVAFIIGDFTAGIGDPSGQDKTRPRLKRAEILKNAATYKRQVFKILRKDRTDVHFNGVWFRKMSYDHTRMGMLAMFLARYSVQQLMERDDFARRMKAGQGITMLEALYPIYQGYDSVMVKADIEVGGSDQLFNLLWGREMQRDFGQPPQVVMTFPLLEGTDGVKKMSKSYGNHIALDDSPEEIFGKVMSIPDALTPKYAELLTEIPLDEVRSAHPMEAKKRVARVIVERFHGRAAAADAQAHFEKVFSRREVP